MKIVQKGNRQLRVPDDRLSGYLDKGYAEVDEKTGKLIRKESADKEATLKRENTALKKENKELKDQLAKLTAQPQ